MALTDPQQELFSFLRAKLIEAFGEDSVHDGRLPPEDTPYPFIYLGECRMNDTAASKDYIGAAAYIDIHVWSDDPARRGTFSRMLLAAKQACFSARSTGHYTWSYRGAEERILADNTTTIPLLHGIITAEFHLQGGTTT